MEYSKIVSVTGMPGLYELVSTKTDGAVVRSLADKSSHFISSRIHRFSHLESIEVFTTGANVNLAEVFFAMEKSTEPLPDEKDAAAVKNYFQKVYPDMDFEKVYNSDMKKMIKWFHELRKNNIEIKLPPPPQQEEPVAETPVEVKEEKPADTQPDKPVKKEKEEKKAAAKTTKTKPAAKKEEKEKPAPSKGGKPAKKKKG
jgi:outer membrane biosynthesis protein TonB